MLNINVDKFFKLYNVSSWRGVDGEVYYTVSVISKMTGELLSIVFDSPHFDELLAEMERNVKWFEEQYWFDKTKQPWFL